jgi:hypothetical protein
MPLSIKERLKLSLQLILSGELPRSEPVTVAPISTEEVAEARKFFPLEKFFIFGHARSGTTMLVRLVRLHPQVYCDYQAHFFTRSPLLQSLVGDAEVRQWLSRGSNRWNRGRDLSPVVLRAAADYILEREAKREGKTIVGDKSPNNLMNGEAVRLMHQVYPDARLVYIVRDGRDAALSHRIQGFIDFPNQLSREDLRIRDEFASNPTPFLNGERSLFSNSAIRSAAESWERNVRETDTKANLLYPQSYYPLRYEDLLDETWKEIRQLWSFLGADVNALGLEEIVEQEMRLNPDAAYQQQKAREIAEPLEKGKRGTWQELFTEDDKQIFLDIAGEMLAKWGYLNEQVQN